jgi:zinc protease
MASIEKAYNDRTKTNSENFVGEFQANLENEPASGIEWTFKTFKQILPLIELKDVKRLNKDNVKEDNRVIILTGPEKEGKKVTEQEVLAAIKVNTDELKPYEDAG